MSLLELLIAAAIGLMALAASIYIFVFQQTLLKDENDATKVRAKGRQAIKFLAREIRMAGFGLPPGGAMTDIGTPNSISFRTNKSFDGREARTQISLATTGIAKDDTSLQVLDGTKFKAEDNIVIYQTGFFLSEENVVGGSGGSSASIPLASPFPEDYKFGFKASLITVNKFNDWTIELVDGEIRKTIDANTTVLVGELEPAPQGLEFDYAGIDAADTSKIGITLNLVDPDNDNAVIEFKTDVTLRNLGIQG